MTWQIGNVRITRIVEIETASIGTFVLPDATPEAILAREWLRPNFADDEGNVIMSIHALVVESDDKRIVVDTCIGNDKPRPLPDWNMLQTSFLRDLEGAGHARESVDFVVCTHLHVDHVGWNTMLVDGRWAPTFPNARYLIGRKEWEFWSKEEDLSLGDILGDSVRPVFEAGLVELVDPDHALTSEVRLEPTPGHTPGHVSVRISSAGEEAVITGDLMHHPVQCQQPEWASAFDTDAEQARETRRDFLERYADSGVRVIGTHFATPTLGQIRARDGAWRFEV